MPHDVAHLVTAARDGDRAAFDELVRATYAETFTLALRLTGNEEDARDVVQEAYIRAFRGLSRFRGDAQFSTWMYRITANCANTHLVKRTKHRHEVLDDANPIADDRPAADPQLQADATALRAPAHRRPGGPSPQAPPGGGAARHLRPAPRGDRGRARDLRDGGQGAPPPGAQEAAGGPVPPPCGGGR